MKPKHRQRNVRIRVRKEDKKEAVVKKKTVGIGFLNANGCTEVTMRDIEETVSYQDLDVVCVAETKMREEQKEKLKIKGFDTHETRRSDADGDKQGGGLAIFTRQKDGIIFKRYNPKIKDARHAFVERERLWITYNSIMGKTAVCCLYLGCQNVDDSHGRWNDDILSVVASEVYDIRAQGYRVTVQGDFNSWVGCDLKKGGIPGNDVRVNKNGERFVAFCRDNSLVHLNGAVRKEGDWSTRISSGLWTRHAPSYGPSTVLDYSLVSIEHMETVRSFHVDEGGDMGGSSDHCFLVTRLLDHFVKADRTKDSPSKVSWDIKDDQDWTGYREKTGKALEDIGGNDDGSAEFLNNKLQKVFIKSMEEAIGYKNTALPPSDRKLPKAMVLLLKERKKLEADWKKQKSLFAKARYGAQNTSILVAQQALDDKVSEVNEGMKRFNKQGRRKLLNLCKSKSRKAISVFWRHVSRKEKSSTRISALQCKKTGVLLCKPEEVAEEAYQYMKNIFNGADNDDETMEEEVEGRGPVAEDPEHSYAQQLPRGATVDDHGYGVSPRPVLKSKDTSKTPETDPTGFLDKDFSDKEVKDVVAALQNGKAAGWDKIPNEAIKEAHPSLLVQLKVLFNRVKNRAEVPAGWKHGRLVLVHKKGSTMDVSNYRPLTVLGSVSGVYTKLLNQRLTTVVEEHRLLGEVQHGFRKGRSGADCGFIMNSVLWKSSATRKLVHMAFIDLQKAYDSVDRKILWEKLESMGIKGKFLESLKKLYQGDYVSSEVNGVTTPPLYLKRGVRQGCSLSPMLFALYIASMGQDLTLAGVGMTLHRVCVSALFFAVSMAAMEGVEICTA